MLAQALYQPKAPPGARFLHAISRSTRASSAETLTSLEDIDEESLQLAQEAEHADTRQEAETEALIDELLIIYKGDAGSESLGVPLFNAHKLEETWEQQRSHCACMQDPPGISLYKIVGRKSRGV
ncbi:hypothetical protein ElyMa_001115800 [Elysia marginata]|uniref:Uncharacterized protein n=1 Tax=Elysia marginata TaxID=1093978 RepID=A0AAV4HW30_9GAST|nr:hypothetical protein ElyMa_001115800 [Elysia marginata]